MGQNYAGMVFSWSSFRIKSDDPDSHLGWPLLLRIENLAKESFKIYLLKLLGQLTQTIMEWSQGGVLLELCPIILTAILVGSLITKNKKFSKKLLKNYLC